MSQDSEDLDLLFESISATVRGADKENKNVGGSECPKVDIGREVLSDSPIQKENCEDLYGRLGNIVRNLHDSLRELGLDKSLSESAASITDAKDRLAYIATLTEQAANKVLNTLDQAIPAQTSLSTRAEQLNLSWKEMYGGKLSVEEFKQLSESSMQFSEDVRREAELEKSRLLEIMMAQDFQDLTGQIIKKVISVTQDVEKDLAQLLIDNAPADVRERVSKAKPVDLMSGPAIPTQAMAQDDVDDLLEGLGF